MEKQSMLNKEKSILIVATGLILASSGLIADEYEHQSKYDKDVNIELFAPAKGDSVGIDGRGWFIDIAVQFEGDLSHTGFSGNQLTGPGPHNNVAPFPGTFSPGVDDRFSGLIVLLNTTTIGGGSCQNLANLFNLTGVTNVTDDEVEIWDTWLVGAPLFGQATKSKTFIAVAADLNGDGIYNDAPAVVPDFNNDGKCDKKDLKAYGVSSNIVKSKFYIN